MVETPLKSVVNVPTIRSATDDGENEHVMDDIVKLIFGASNKRPELSGAKDCVFCINKLYSSDKPGGPSTPTPVAPIGPAGPVGPVLPIELYPGIIESAGCPTPVKINDIYHMNIFIARQKRFFLLEMYNELSDYQIE